MRLASFLIAAVFAMTAAVSAEDYNGYETPPYTVIESLDGAEVRQYGAHVLAQVQVQGGRTMAANRGFRTLANYIFGGNAQGAKIAMTTPVAQSRTGETWVVSFMMPAKYTLDNLPTAQTDTITFTQKPGDRQIVRRFSGVVSGRLDGQESQLRAIADAAGKSVTGSVKYYFYDDPLTLPWNRRNEVAFSLR